LHYFEIKDFESLPPFPDATEILSKINDGALRLCRGRNGPGPAATRLGLGNVLVESLADEVVYRSRNCSYVATKGDSDVCAACGVFFHIKREEEGERVNDEAAEGEGGRKKLQKMLDNVTVTMTLKQGRNN
jgi:hypothetical protein